MCVEPDRVWRSASPTLLIVDPKSPPKDFAGRGGLLACVTRSGLIDHAGYGLLA
jgi:hypothetical protein